MEKVFGIHAVESLLQRRASSVQRLILQKGRDDKRVQALADLAAERSALRAMLDLAG